MKSFGVALLGCQHPHSRWHLATLRLLPEVDRVWLWDPDLAAAEALAMEAGQRLAGATDQLGSLLGRGDLQAVLVARRNDETPATILSALEAGKHVLSEKPMATHDAAVPPLIETARKAGVALGVLYPWRAHAVARDLRRHLVEGHFGRPLSVEARMVTSQVRFRDPEHWLFRRPLAGGGVLAWLGCHFLDLLRFLLQDEVVEVTALTANTNREAIEVEDTAALALRFASGALGTFHAGYLLARSVPGYKGATYDTYLSVKGSLGRFAWEPTAKEPAARLESAHPDWAGAPERTLVYPVEPCEAYGGRHGLEFVREFLHAAGNGKPPPATGEDALAVLRIIAAAYESSATGRRAALDAGVQAA